MKCSVIIMAGGSGQRLWPLSTKQFPKQFCSITGEQSLLRKTLQRFDFISSKNIYISSSESYKDIIEKDYSDYPFILEPYAMDTAPAICLNSLSIEGDDDDVLIFCPSDHYIKEIDQFQEDIKEAIKFFKDGGDGILLIGIEPTYPATGYGYIKSDLKENKIGIVDVFKEKPNLSTAQEYLKKGNYYWNSGIFCFKKVFIKEAFKMYQPQMLKKIEEYIKTKEISLYKDVKKISFDFAILEKIKNQIHVLKNNFNWSDVGSWNNLNNLFADKNNNYLLGKYQNFSCQNTLIQNHSSINLVINGVSNLNIIIANNTVYIEDKDTQTNIKTIIDNLNN